LRVQEKACGALEHFADKDNNSVYHSVLALPPSTHKRIIRAIIHAMDRYQGDARVQEKACGALEKLAHNHVNKDTLVKAEAHMCIIRAMDRHQDDFRVQEKAIWV
jgi:histone H3/H4